MLLHLVGHLVAFRSAAKLRTCIEVPFGLVFKDGARPSNGSDWNLFATLCNA